ncbi:MAG: GAF domain-containing protein [Chloroflexi bacterium]|nr:GAF domain-containing protein [Chloroflexota bacterium]
MAFDSDLQNPSTPRGSLQENILANISVPWKLNLLILVMIIGIIAVFSTALQGINAIQNQQQYYFTSISASITALNDADIALGEIQTELILLENTALSPQEINNHLEKITNAENIAASTLQEYETDWLPLLESTLNSGIPQNRKEEIQQTLEALQNDEILLFAQINNNYQAYTAESAVYYQNIKKGKYDEQVEDQITNLLTLTHPSLRQLISMHSERQLLSNEISQSIYLDLGVRMIFALALAVGIGLIFANSVARSISSRLDILGNNALALQDDLLDRRSNISVIGNDEIALVSRSFDEMSGRLREMFADLENKVKERTVKLAAATAESNKRAQQFEAITIVARAISATPNLQELLPQISSAISEQFGFYHVGIFLNDPTNQTAMLLAANSEGGKKMLQRNHQLRIGEQGIVGYVTQTGKSRIALDVGEDANYFDNPELPSTHSEMALPLKTGGQVIGALDIQSTEVGAFTDDDFEALSALAEQVSLAIQNARLFDQIKKTLSESESIQRQYIRESWGRLSKEEKLSGFWYSGAGVIPLDDESKIAASEETNEKRRISVPISLRGETIGTLSVQVQKNQHVSADQVDLIKAVAESVALSAENARLFEETSTRAERERLVSEITTKIRTTNDPQEMIHTAVDELKRALGVTRIEIVPQKMTPPDN